LRWLAYRRIDTACLDRRKRWQNGRDVRFNGTFRDECLNVACFRSCAEARVLIAAWRKLYNQLRPHSKLNSLIPSGFVNQMRQSVSLVAMIKPAVVRRNQTGQAEKNELSRSGNTTSHRPQPVKNGQTFSRVALTIAWAALAFTYVAWELVGLRYINYDDITFYLRSWTLYGDYLGAAETSAFRQARLHWFMNMPPLLWVSKMADSRLYDVLNIGVFAAMYASLIWLLAQLSNLKIATAIAVMSMLLFPLHYYFMFPQGYAVIGASPPTFGFAAAALLGSHIRNRKPWKIICSVVLFAASLSGPEYNYVLHPMLLLIVTSSLLGFDFRRMIALAWPYVLVLSATAAAYLAFSIFSRSGGGDSIGRISFGWDISSGFSTFVLLQEKAFVPLALWRGIGLHTAVPQGVPQTPQLLTFEALWSDSNDLHSIVLVLVVAAVASAALLAVNRPSKRSLCHLAAALFAIAAIPCAVLSVSSHYHTIVLAGYLQGHPVSTYIHFGLSGLVFLFFLSVSAAFSTRWKRYLAASTSIIILACAMTFTFVYNNVNRQVMSANKQKWDAMRELSVFMRASADDLKQRTVFAPSFWTYSGVSGIPDISRSTSKSYWSEFANVVLGTPIEITDANGDFVQDALHASYVSTPQGSPVVILQDSRSQRNYLLAATPVAGTIITSLGASQKIHVAEDEWNCAAQCAFTWASSNELNRNTVDFEPDDHGPTRLYAQFLLQRDGQYGYPLTWRSKLAPPMPLQSLKVLDWGPRESTVGIIGNPQPDGDGGIWVRTSRNTGLGDVHVIVDGQIMTDIVVASELITFTVPIGFFLSSGKKAIEIEQVSTRERLLVGYLYIQPE
jgi:hypothetical protein